MGRQKKNIEKVPGVRIWKRTGEGADVRYKLSYFDEKRQKDRTVRGSTFYDLCIEQAEKIARRQERIRLRLATPAEDRHEEQDDRPLSEHLEDWRKGMVAAGLDKKHVRQFNASARAVLLGTPIVPAPTAPDGSARKAGRGERKSVIPIKLPDPGFGRVSSVVASKVYEQVGRIRAGRSAATANRSLDAVNAFLNWGEQDHRWPVNVCRHLKKYSTEEDAKVIRRAISPGDFSALILATAGGPVIAGLTGAERSLLYRFAVATGLRANEVRNVRVRDVDFDGPRLGVWTRAQISRKNKRRQFVRLAESMRTELLELAAGLTADDHLLKCPANTARMLKEDLKEAGIPYTTPEGRFDFHAIRHETGTLLISGGANVKAVQRHMRHAKSQMTLDVYGHLLEDDHASAVDGLPDFTKTEAQRKAQRRGGIECPQMSANVRAVLSKSETTPVKPGLSTWSHGESNPDLLNAIQPSHFHNTAPENNLQDESGEGAAPCAALRGFFRFRGRIIARKPRPTINRRRRAASRQVRVLSTSRSIKGFEG